MMARRDYRDRDGNKLPGVTTVLDDLGWSKRTLMAWANREGLAGRKLTKQAADRGSLVHALLEAELLESDSMWNAAMAECPAEDADRAKQLADASCARIREIGAVVDVELPLVFDDPAVGYGGTLDVVVREHGTGHFIVVDLKTGGGVYGETRVQLGAYGMLHEHCGRGRFARGAVVHAPWDGDGVTVYAVERDELDRGAAVFACLRTIYAQREHIEGRISG